jgi:Cdc6-like AAA superfamily ATPase
LLTLIMSYIKRIIEEDLLEKLSASGALLIKGPKSCGKTATASQFTKSVVEMDRDKQVPNTAKMDLPKSLNIITGTGMSHRRPDGINVISLASLGK